MNRDVRRHEDWAAVAPSAAGWENQIEWAEENAVAEWCVDNDVYYFADAQDATLFQIFSGGRAA